MSPDWPNRSTPRATTRCRATAPSQESVAGWPSSTVTSAAPGESASSRISTCERAPASPRFGAGGGQPVGVQPAGRGDHQQPGPGMSSRIWACASIASGVTTPEQTTARLGPGPGGTSQYPRGRCGSRSSGVIARSRLVDRPGREPEVDRAAVVVLDVPQGPGQDRGQLVDERGLERRQAGLAHADQRRDDRLVRASLRSQAHARWRGHQQELRPLVAGVIRARRDRGR